MFKDVKFMSAHEKELTLKAWERFVKNGFSEKDFSKRLYQHITLHCSFIAHYSRNGFYAYYFEDLERTIQFLTQFDKDYNYQSIEYFSNAWLTAIDYHDLNFAMCEAIEPYKKALYSSLRQNIKDTDIARAKQLLSKHNVTL